MAGFDEVVMVERPRRNTSGHGVLSITSTEGTRALIRSSKERLCFWRIAEVRIVTPPELFTSGVETSVLGAGCAEHAQSSAAPRMPALPNTEPAMCPPRRRRRAKWDCDYPLGLQAVPGLAHRQNVPRHGGIALELPAQIRHVRVERPAHHVGFVAPHFLEQLDASRRRAIAPDERQQQLELEGSQLYRRAGAPHLARRGVHLDVAETVGHA